MLPKCIMLAFRAGLQVLQCTAEGFRVSIPGAGCLQSWQLPVGTGEGPGPHDHPTAAASGAMAGDRGRTPRPPNCSSVWGHGSEEASR